MTIQIDVWSGDCHQTLCREYYLSNWVDAVKIIEQEVEAGMLVNVLHTDFKAPPEKAKSAMLSLLHEATK